MEAANSVRPLPTFDYVPTSGCEPSQTHVPVRSHYRSDERWLAWRTMDDLMTKIATGPLEWMPCRTVGRTQEDLRNQPRPLHPTLPIPDALPGLRSRSKSRSLKKTSREGDALLSDAQPGFTNKTGPPLLNLADKEQIDRFLKRGPLFLCKECESACREPREEECST
ncbi:LOW QUALITY PROTEIN: hypothetical protein Cgig2_018590 [Carnegiea gigantea]|uniref:Uncharacterized protein n=1 Tax=Carnegiea gigantea TaxID=171969 RepID=A0A9Q1K4Y2_9CARY|nr:LOW QUALITY PROTEIN: hypothetical protein Cgig2_018590 [Carnegiea gigantea]